jgi:hypothetical protein
MSEIGRTIQCTTCRGSGEMESSDSTDDRIYKCWACDGTGEIADRRADAQLAGAVPRERVDAALAMWDAFRMENNLDATVGFEDVCETLDLLRARCGASPSSELPKEDTP